MSLDTNNLLIDSMIKKNKVKSIIKNLLEKIDLYENVRYSIPYSIYLRFSNPSYLKSLDDDFKFYKSLIGINKNLLIFDIGAFHGDKTAVFLRLGAKVVSVEPDRKSLEVLKVRFGNNKNVVIIGKAVSYKAGIEKFYIEKKGSAYNTLSSTWKESLEHQEINKLGLKMDFHSSYNVETATLDSLIRQFGVPYYIKIDVEGYEYNAIQRLSQRVPLLSFEVNAPVFKQEIIDCLNHLHKIASQSKFNYSVTNKLELGDFVCYAEFMNFFHKTELRYMEIYCKMAVN